MGLRANWRRQREESLNVKIGQQKSHNPKYREKQNFKDVWDNYQETQNMCNQNPKRKEKRVEKYFENQWPKSFQNQ